MGPAGVGHAELGDARIVAALAEHPVGKVQEVFHSGAKQQGAYDLLRNSQVRAESLLAAVETATVRRCAGRPWVHVAVDGTSLQLTNCKRQKDFATIESTSLAHEGQSHSRICRVRRLHVDRHLEPAIVDEAGAQKAS